MNDVRVLDEDVACPVRRSCAGWVVIAIQRDRAASHGDVVALDVADGSPIWQRTFRHPVFGLRGAAGVFYANKYLESRWIALNGRDGSVLRRFEAEGLIVANDRIVTHDLDEVTIWGPP